MSFRCAAASEERSESMAGTASTVRSFLLVEHPGPWGVDALRDARMPDGIGPELRARAAATGTKVLLIRRPAGASRDAEGVRVFAAYAHHAEPWLETTVLGDLAEVHDLDLEALGGGRSPGLSAHPGPVLAVCTHGRHDACCAERGRPVAAGLAELFPEQTWEVSHIGGDRFAGNLLVLPYGFYFGRLDPVTARGVARLLAAGEVDLDHLRGRSGLPMSLQAAEAALRRHVDERRVSAVRLLSREVHDGRTDAVFDVDGRRYAVAVTSSRGPELETLTCRALRQNPVMHHEVHEIRAL
ncbi:MAG TPA: sucrase ferredoxin [Nocardioides sp.]|uniref:sucrase ferredoxin n=1 Tax=Nocardioides sp. TaxID=35761 RepID=UPI002E3056C5|nr:sucrase ferredoxin [Nocardioides sp.]HEX5090953.1 sucrase ferredoxin [Nocardioides sp.]